MRTPRCCAVALALLLATASSALAQTQAAGRVKIATGAVSIVRQGAPIAAKVGDLVWEGDTLRTGADGQLGVTLKDDSRMSLGPNSEARLDRFLFGRGAQPPAFCVPRRGTPVSAG